MCFSPLKLIYWCAACRKLSFLSCWTSNDAPSEILQAHKYRNWAHRLHIHTSSSRSFPLDSPQSPAVSINNHKCQSSWLKICYGNSSPVFPLKQSVCASSKHTFTHTHTAKNRRVFYSVYFIVLVSFHLDTLCCTKTRFCKQW